MKTIIFLTALGFSINIPAQDNIPGSYFLLISPDSFQNNTNKIKKDTWRLGEINADDIFGPVGSYQKQFLEPPVQLIDSVYVWQWDTLLSGWSNYQRTYDMIYDVNNNLTFQLIDFRNQDVWEKFTQWMISYDENNDKSKELIQSWNGNDYENSLQRVYTHNDSHKTIYALYQVWQNNTWVNFSQFISTYDASGNQTSYIIQEWNGSEWASQHRYLTTYNSNNDAISRLFQYWYNAVWNNDEKSTISYDSNNNIIYALTQKWYVDAWYDLRQATFTYDSINNTSTEIAQGWNGSMWTNNYQRISNYDPNNNLIHFFINQWNGTNYRNYYEEMYTYDADNFLLGKSSKYFNIDGLSITGADSTHYYFQTISDTKNIQAEFDQITISPNPTSGEFKIGCTEAMKSISCYNILGECIYQTYNLVGENAVEIDLTPYGKGIYLIRIAEGKKICTRKIIIQ